jgi:hypothetical protein
MYFQKYTPKKNAKKNQRAAKSQTEQTRAEMSTNMQN